MITRVNKHDYKTIMTICYLFVIMSNKSDISIKYWRQQLTYHECKKTCHSMHNKMLKMSQASSTYSLS